VQQVLAIPVAAPELVLRGKPAVRGEQWPEPLGNRGGIVDQPLGIVEEGGERRRGHMAMTAAAPGVFPGR
jgi:hypothetical protein